MEASKESANVARGHLGNLRTWAEANGQAGNPVDTDALDFLAGFIEAAQKRLPSALAIQRDRERKKKYRKGAKAGAGAEAGQ